RLERGPDADGMAHDDIARQLRLLGFAHHHVAERAHAGIDPVGANALANDGLHQFASRADSRARSAGQLQVRALRNVADFAPAQRAVEENALRHPDGAQVLPAPAAARAAAAARHVSRSPRLRSRITPTSRELRTAPGLLNAIWTEATPKSSRMSMAMCSARVSTR